MNFSEIAHSIKVSFTANPCHCWKVFKIMNHSHETISERQIETCLKVLAAAVSVGLVLNFLLGPVIATTAGLFAGYIAFASDTVHYSRSLTRGLATRLFGIPTT